MSERTYWQGGFITGGGQTFTDDCYASNSRDAERTLKARNPTAHMHSITPKFTAESK